MLQRGIRKPSRLSHPLVPFFPGCATATVYCCALTKTGIVIKYESMEYRAAVHHAALVLDLASKSKKYMRELFEPPDVSCCLVVVYF